MIFKKKEDCCCDGLVIGKPGSKTDLLKVLVAFQEIAFGKIKQAVIKMNSAVSKVYTWIAGDSGK